MKARRPAPPKRKLPARRTRDAAATRTALLRAAIAEFAVAGLSGGRVERIAAAARSHDRMIYYYFGSKEGLFIAALEEIYRQLNEAEAAITLDFADPAAALRAIVAFTWNYYLDHPEMITLLNSENLHHGVHARKSGRVRELSSPALAILERVLAEGVRRKLFRPDLQARELYLTIAALGYFYLSNRFTLSAFLDTDLMAVAARTRWLDLITDNIERFVART